MKKTDRQIEIMGILNLTDDSFYSASRCADVDAAVSRVAAMLDEGADIIDIGACSTRPGSQPVGADQEWLRLEPVLKALKQNFPNIRLSVDTYWSSVVRRVYDLIGDFIINDISAGEDDPEMLPTVGSLGLSYVAMHKRGTAATMQDMCDYEDIVHEVGEYFRDFALKAEKHGIKDWVLDPGFGFAKTVEQNYQLLNGLERIRGNQRVLVGVSRKSMIYKPLGITPEEALSATQALHMAALIKGADILRVHDVKEAVQTRLIYKSLL